MNNRWIKKRTLRLFFAFEIIGFVIFYLFGSHGMQHMMELQYEQCDIEQKIKHAQVEIEKLNEDITQWDTTPFFKEKIAREKLQMVHEGDEVYYLS